jgi:hypothetical protein
MISRVSTYHSSTRFPVQVVAATGDSIRSALAAAYTASYDAAAVGDFILVNYTSYNSVFTSLSNTAKYGNTDAELTGSDAGTQWGAPFIFAYHTFTIPSNSYVIGYSATWQLGSTNMTASLYYTTASGNPTGSVGNAVGSPMRFTSPPASANGSRAYFIRKAPTSPLSTVSASYMYTWYSAGVKVKNTGTPIYYKNVGTSAPATAATGSWLTWNSGGPPSRQFMTTTTKAW